MNVGTANVGLKAQCVMIATTGSLAAPHTLLSWYKLEGGAHVHTTRLAAPASAGQARTEMSHHTPRYNSKGSPSASTCHLPPPSSTTMRACSAWSDGRCPKDSTLTPASANAAYTLASMAGDIAEVASSSTASAGCWTSTRARARRCTSPGERRAVVGKDMGGWKRYGWWE